MPKSKQQLEAADIILLLITPRFIASDDCFDLEMQRAVERHDQGTARVIPIIDKAIEYYQQALEFTHETGDCQGEGRGFICSGKAYRIIGQYQSAIDYYEQALPIARETEDIRAEGAALGSLGITYEKLGDYIQASDYAHQHLLIACEIGDKRGEGAGLQELGVALLKQNSLSEALGNLQAALNIFQDVKSRSDESEALKNLAELHQALGEIGVARQYARQALALATELGIPLKAECEALLAELDHRPNEAELS